MPGSVFKIVTAVAGLGSGADHAGDDLRGAADGRARRAPGRGLPGPRRPPPAYRHRALDLVEATEASCNIWYALTGHARRAATTLVDCAGRLGFGAPIPFDLPTAVVAGRRTATAARRAGSATRSSWRTRPTARPRRSSRRSRWRSSPRRSRTAATLMRPHLVDRDRPAAAGRGRSRPSSSARDRARATPRRSPRRCAAPSRARSGASSRPARRCPGVPTAGKSGTAELGGERRAALVVHRLRAGRAAAGRDRGPRRARRAAAGSAASPHRRASSWSSTSRRSVTTGPTASGPSKPDAAADRERRPWLERIGLAAIAVVMCGAVRRRGGRVLARRRVVPRRDGRDRRLMTVWRRRPDARPRLNGSGVTPRDATRGVMIALGPRARPANLSDAGTGVPSRRTPDRPLAHSRDSAERAR